MKKAWFFLSVLLGLAVLAAACQSSGETTAPSAPSPTQASIATAVPPTDTPPPTPTPEPTALPPDVQRVVFTGEHGAMVGYYYPAADPDAPLIVLIPWLWGDQTDLCTVALWLQNRAAENPTLQPSCEQTLANYAANGGPDWFDASWFAPLPEELSLAVFTFDFPGVGESQDSAWVDVTAAYRPGRHAAESPLSRGDLAAAMNAAASLENVDPGKVAVIGFGAGADAAETACLVDSAVAQAGGCLGVFAAGPQDHWGEAYAETVKAMKSVHPRTKQWCAHSMDPACGQAKEEVDRYIKFPGGGSGLDFFYPDYRAAQPDNTKNITDFIVDFVQDIRNAALAFSPTP